MPAVAAAAAAAGKQDFVKLLACFLHYSSTKNRRLNYKSRRQAVQARS